MTTPPASSAAAFFDFDGTMVGFNSGTRFAKYEYQNGRIGRAGMLMAGIWFALYKFSLIDITGAYGRAVRRYKGTPEVDIDALSRSWFKAEIAEHLLPAARAAMQEHRAKGHPLILLSSTSSYMATAIAEAYGMDGWMANRFPTDADGRLLGTFEAPLCYGAGKVTRAAAWAAANRVDLSASFFYTDSYSDKPMLDVVGHPRAVNPDPRLRRHARRAGWPVLDWADAG